MRQVTKQLQIFLVLADEDARVGWSTDASQEACSLAESKDTSVPSEKWLQYLVSGIFAYLTINVRQQ